MKRKNRCYLSEPKICRDHTPITDTERGEIFCKLCGTVISDRLEDAQHEDQYRDSSTFQTRSRTGPSISLSMHDKGLNTIIGNDKDSSGHSIPSKARIRFHRLREWDKRSKSVSKTRNLGAAFTLLHGIKTKLAIPENVTEKAAYLYRKALDQKLVRGRSVPPILLACLYAACRETNTPRSLEDLSKAGNIRRSSLSRAHRLVVRSLDLKLEQYDISTFITRMGNNLNLKEKTKRDAFEIIEKCKQKQIVEGKNPVAFAAAALYVACLDNGDGVTQGKMTDVSGISSVTIRNTVALIKKALKIAL